MSDNSNEEFSNNEFPIKEIEAINRYFDSLEHSTQSPHKISSQQTKQPKNKIRYGESAASNIKATSIDLTNYQREIRNTKDKIKKHEHSKDKSRSVTNRAKESSPGTDSVKKSTTKSKDMRKSHESHIKRHGSGNSAYKDRECTNVGTSVVKEHKENLPNEIKKKSSDNSVVKDILPMPILIKTEKEKDGNKNLLPNEIKRKSVDNSVVKDILPMPILIKTEKDANKNLLPNEIQKKSVDNSVVKDILPMPILIKTEKDANKNLLPNEIQKKSVDNSVVKDILPMPIILIKKERQPNRTEDGETENPLLRKIKTEKADASPVNSEKDTEQLINIPLVKDYGHKPLPPKEKPKIFADSRNDEMDAEKTANKAKDGEIENPLLKKIKVEKEDASPVDAENDLESLIEIPLVKDYGHKPLPTTEKIHNKDPRNNFVKPIIVKCHADDILPRPIEIIKIEAEESRKRSREYEFSNPIPKKIKRGNETTSNAVGPLIREKKKDIDNCNKALRKLKDVSDFQKFTRFSYTAVTVKPSVAYEKNQSLLLPSLNVSYEFSTSNKINYRDFGLRNLPACATNVARIVGIDIEELLYKNSLHLDNFNNLSNNKAATNNNLRMDSSYFSSISTQTDEIYCAKCISNENKYANNMHNIDTQTEEEDELPILKNFKTLNMNQQLALNNFYEEICGSKPTNANDKLKLRERLLTIFYLSCKSEETIIYPLQQPMRTILPQQPMLTMSAPNPYYSSHHSTQNFELAQPQIPPPGIYQQQQHYLTPQQYSQQQYIPSANYTQHSSMMPTNQRSVLNDPRIRRYNDAYKYSYNHEINTNRY